MRLTAVFKLYKICILLHRCNLNIFEKKSVSNISNVSDFCENSANFCKRCKICTKICKIQLDDLI